MKAKIRVGAELGQDRGYVIWEECDKDIIFRVEQLEGGSQRYKCVADGFGSFRPGDKYGNGALYADGSDLIFIKDNPVTFIPEKLPPPIGLRARFVVDDLRIREILEAMTRYADECKKIPNEWMEELVELNGRKRGE